MEKKKRGIILIDKGYLKFSVYDVLVIFYFAHKLIPAFGLAMPAVVYLGLFGVLMLMTLFARDPNYTSKMIAPMVPLIVVLLFSCLEYIVSSNVLALPMYIYGELQILLFIWIALKYMNFDRETSVKRLFAMIIISYVITGITTVIGCLAYPNAAKSLAVGTGDMMYDFYVGKNIGGFTFTYETVLMTPLYIYMLKKKVINRFMGIFLIVFSGIVVTTTQYTTALMIYILTLVVLLFVKITPRRLIAIGIIAALLVVLLPSTLSNAFSMLADSFESENISERLDYVASVIGGDNSAESAAGEARMELYKKSLESFVKSGGWGSWSNAGVSGHSFVLDTLAYYGYLGIAILIAFFVGIYKHFLKPYKKYDHFGYMLWGFTIAIIMMILNPKTNIFYLCGILTLFGALMKRAEDKKNEVVMGGK